MLECADAALLIGDEVFPHLDGDLESLDLGREWTAMTEFAVCLCLLGWPPAGMLTPAQVQQLQWAKERGLCQVPSIAAAYRPRMRRLARVLRALPDPSHPL